VEQRNYFTRPGAEKLQGIIERYWRRKGYRGIETRIVEHICDRAELEPRERATIYFVRSNIGPLGFPPVRKPDLEAA
jgi:hypothetical protein